MRSLTFVVSKGGVGKSLITANVGAALAHKGKEVVLVEGDPNKPLQKILGINLSNNIKLNDVIQKDVEITQALYPTIFPNLLLVPSGISLQSYFDIDPLKFAQKLKDLSSDFMFIDIPFPLGKAAFLSLGVCQYFIPILTEDEFVLCVESAIDTIRLGKYLLRSVPIGYIMNRIKSQSKFTEELLKDIEGLLEVPCIAKILEDPQVSKSYGEVGSKKAFLAYERNRRSEFSKSIDKIASTLLKKTPEPEDKDVEQLLQDIAKMSKH